MILPHPRVIQHPFLIDCPDIFCVLLIFVVYFTSEQNIGNPQVPMAQSNQKEPSIVVQGLTYRFQNGAPGLNNVDLDLPSGSRTLLIGGKNSIATLTNLYGM